MQLLVLARWGLREWGRSGPAWALATAAVLVGPACWVLVPQGILGDWAANRSYSYSIWYLSSYLGTMAGLLLLDRARAAWLELGAWGQSTVSLLTLAVVAALHALVALLVLSLLGGADALAWGPALLCVAHWAALGTFLRRTPMSLPAMCIAASCLGWLIPALIAGNPELERLRWLLAPQRHLELPEAAVDTSIGVLVDTIPLVAWWVAAALLPTRSAFRR